MEAIYDVHKGRHGDSNTGRGATKRPLLAYSLVATLVAALIGTVVAGPEAGGLVAIVMIPVLLFVVIIDPGGPSPFALTERAHHSG